MDNTGATTIGANKITSAKILDGELVNADINSAAAIAYSKLNLAGSLVNADLSATAAIADTKLAQLTTAGKVADSALSASEREKNPLPNTQFSEKELNEFLDTLPVKKTDDGKGGRK